ncbi:MAG TPA: MFS transporter [Solirubrobacterales bacterium]|nr:MFS transporter [Solirubrobacterales bacterium]
MASKQALRRAMTREVVLASVGGMLVFYSVTVIAYSLPFVGQALFETQDRVQGALNTLALLAGGYLAKPLAQAMTGPYADRHGRKPVLAGAALLAAFTALLFAALPSESTIGLAAPILFCALTVLQAAAAGSEWPLLAAYVAESTPAERRGAVTAFASFNVVLGWMLALAIPLVLDAMLSESQYSDWGWRVAFLPAVALGVLSFLLRRGLPESQVFVRLRAAGELSPSPLREVVRTARGNWLAVTLQVGMVSAAFFLTVAYPATFVALEDKFTHVEALTVALAGLVTLAAGIRAGGALADRLGPRSVSATGYLLLAALAVPAYVLMSEGSIPLAFAGVVLVAAPLSLSAGVYEAWLVSSFRTRFTGAAATCNGVAIAIFGAPSLLVATLLVRDQGELAPAVLLVLVGAVGALSTRLLGRSIHEPLG